MDNISFVHPSMTASLPKSSEETRQCTQCKARVSVVDPHKMCAACRERQRVRSAQRAQKKRALLEANSGIPGGDVTPKLKRQLEENRAETVQQAKKRPRTSQASGKVDGNADGPVKRKKTKPGKKNNVEYQTATEMYTKLHVLSKTKKYLFNGHYSIIANPETDNHERVVIVAKDLRNVAQIPFEGKSITSGTEKDISYASFRCNCLCDSTKPIATLNGRDPNVIASSPTDSALSWHKQSHYVPRCKGKVKVMCQADSSHPLGIAGQKITVTVEHRV